MTRPFILRRFPAVALTIGSSVVMACASGAPSAPGAETVAEPLPVPGRQTATISAITLAPAEDGGTAVVLTSDRPLRWTTFRDLDGHLIVELPDSRATGGPPDTSDDSLVASIDITHQENGFRSTAATRLRFVTREDAVHALDAAGTGLRLIFRPVASGGGRWTDRSPGEEAAAKPADRTPEATAPSRSPPAIESEALEVSPILVTAPIPEAPAQRRAPPLVPPFRPTETESPAPARDDSAVTAEVADMAPSSRATANTAPSSQATADDRSGLAPTGRAVAAIEARQEAGSLVIELSADGPLPWRSFQLSGPDRYVIDLPGVVNRAGSKLVPVDHPVVERARLAQFRGRPEPVARLVLDLRTANVDLSVTRTPGGLRIEVRETR